APVGVRGTRSHPRVLHALGSRSGIGGMPVTTDGRIVAAAGSGDKAGAYIFSREGKLLEIIPTPEDPANVEFGGEDGKTLYICAGRSLYRIKTNMTGFRLWPVRPSSMVHRRDPPRPPLRQLAKITYPICGVTGDDGHHVSSRC